MSTKNLINLTRTAITYKGAPKTCAHCSDPNSQCQMYNDCDCPETPSCHTTRLRWIGQRREDALAALDELEALIETFDGLDDKDLLQKADYLKGTDGEGWAVGALVEKIVALRRNR